MEGRVQIRCAECGRQRELSGEIPEEYTSCFLQIIREEGFVPRPGVELVFVCGQCLMRYVGHETVNDEEKVRGKRNPKEL